MFTAGSVQNYIKSLELTQKWNQRKNNTEQMKPQTLLDSLKEQQNNHSAQVIGCKLDAGKKLTPAEMEYLRKNHPELYRKAARIAKEREAYEKELKRCRTKEEARRLHMTKTTSLLGEAKSAAANGDRKTCEEAMRRTAAIGNEQITFQSSGRYKQLPQDREEFRRRGGKEQRRGTGDAPQDIRARALVMYDARAKLLTGTAGAPSAIQKRQEELPGNPQNKKRKSMKE